MPEFEIIPPDDERVMCVFTVPRKGRAPLTFTVRRMEYLSPKENEEFDDWFVERTSPKPVVDDSGERVLDGEGEPTYLPPEWLGAPELCLKALEYAGVAKAKLAQVEKLTAGEKIQIWDRWREASQMTLGESPASASS